MKGTFIVSNELKEKFFKQLQAYMVDLRTFHKHLENGEYDNIRVSYTLSVIHKVAGLCLTFGLKELGNVARYLEMRSTKALNAENRNELSNLKPIVLNFVIDCEELLNNWQNSSAKLDLKYEGDKGPLGQAVHLVVADDDPVIRMLMVKKLEENGFTVTAASDGEKAFEKIRTIKPHLAILDQNMPGLHGTEVCQKLFLDDALKDIPIFVLSGYSADEIVDADLLDNIKEIIEKPFNIKDVLPKIEKYL